MAADWTLVTDGACSGNGTEDSRGGWAAIVEGPDGETVLVGAEAPSTNNRMELTGVIEGLRAVPDGVEVELITDSTYVANALLRGWLDGWRRRGWKTAGKKSVANRDLWEAMLVELARVGAVRPTIVKGHAGHPANERADRLAQEAAADLSLDAEAPPSPPGEQLGLGLDGG